MSARSGLLPTVVLLALLAGCGSAPDTGTSTHSAVFGPQAPVAPVATGAVATGAVATAQPAVAPPVVATGPARSAPAALAVSAIGVHTGPLLSLGLDRDGTLEVPPDARSAGWFRLSPAPGSPGPAVIVAHVDYAGVPGVFTHLADLRPGDRVDVTRADGTHAVFTTYRVDRYAKAAFPTSRVYGNTPGPELRLITCGGVFDHGTGQYQDNVVAYARLVG